MELLKSSVGLVLSFAVVALSACDSGGNSVSSSATSTGDTDGIGGSGDACNLGDEDIVFGQILPDAFELSQITESIPCIATAAGFACDGETLDLNSILEPFAPVPWQEGQTVLLTPNAYFFEVSELVVRSESGDLLAVYAEMRPAGVVDPISVSLEPAGCGVDENGRVPLRATYSVEGESIALTGASSGTLPGFEVFQADATDITMESAGEIEQTVSFVAIASL